MLNEKGAGKKMNKNHKQFCGQTFLDYKINNLRIMDK